MRTWAPRGPTPLLRVPLPPAPCPLPPAHRAASSGSTLDGRLCLPTRTAACHAQGGGGVLRVLLRTIRGTVLVLWDGAPLHQGQPSTEFLTRGAAKRVHLERLPGSAPDLHPDEGICNALQRVELQNRCGGDLAARDLERRRAKERLRHTRALIQASSVQCGYSV